MIVGLISDEENEHNISLRLTRLLPKVFHHALPNVTLEAQKLPAERDAEGRIYATAATDILLLMVHAVANEFASNLHVTMRVRNPAGRDGGFHVFVKITRHDAQPFYQGTFSLRILEPSLYSLPDVKDCTVNDPGYLLRAGEVKALFGGHYPSAEEKKALKAQALREGWVTSIFFGKQLLLMSNKS